jgi:hypothetical protein
MHLIFIGSADAPASQVWQPCITTPVAQSGMIFSQLLTF